MTILLILSLILGIILAVAAILVSPQLVYICFDFKDEIIFMRQINNDEINLYKVLFQSLGLLMLLLILEVPVVLWLLSKLRTGIVVIMLALFGVVVGLLGRGFVIVEALSGIPSGSRFTIPFLIVSVGSLLVCLAVCISLATVATAGVTLLGFNAEVATLAVSGTVAGVGAIGGIVNIYKEHNPVFKALSVIMAIFVVSTIVALAGYMERQTLAGNRVFAKILQTVNFLFPSA